MTEAEGRGIRRISCPVASYHDEIWRQVPEVRERPGSEARASFCLTLASKGERVLDLGCGDGAVLPELQSAGVTPVGADPSRVALDRAPAGFELVHLTGEALPFPDGSFDGVWAAEILSHALDVTGTLSEARRVLRPGGWLGVTVPLHGPVRDAARMALRFARETNPGRTEIRRFSPRTLRRTLGDAGFEEVRTKGSGGLAGLRTAIHASARRP